MQQRRKEVDLGWRKEEEGVWVGLREGLVVK